MEKAAGVFCDYIWLSALERTGTNNRAVVKAIIDLMTDQWSRDWSSAF